MICSPLDRATRPGPHWAVRWSLDGRTWKKVGPLARHAAEKRRLELILGRHANAPRLVVRIVPWDAKEMP